jgi:aryl-alcohol dehydrogenase-like predicted oxidoreductase
MTFGEATAWTNDEATSRAQFDRYLEVGGNLIDTDYIDLYQLRLWDQVTRPE